jgi:sigma-B regulation protein RsbU (phosphoserine phosphatase)
MPLGNAIRRPHAEISGQLEPGDTFVLYTDGIIEATDSSGEVFNFDRFEKLLLASWHNDLETYWSGIFKGYSAWSPVQDDDITFLMLRYEKN